MQALLIFTAIILGILFPAGHILTPIIRYNLMFMLFFAFLKVELSWSTFRNAHWKVLIANILLPISFYFLLRPFSYTLAMAGFIMAITPTAAASPVIAGFLQRKIDFVTFSVLFTSPVIALLLPFILPELMIVEGPAISSIDILLPILMIVILPFAVSLFLKGVAPGFTKVLMPIGRISFYLFVINVYIAAASSTQFILTHSDTSWLTIGGVAGLTLLICIIQFYLGEWLADGQLHPWESSLALGRKNTMLAIWIALTFVDPIVALAPMFYIIYQNAYNSWQMYLLTKSDSNTLANTTGS